jgi:hypothetical protein
VTEAAVVAVVVAAERVEKVRVLRQRMLPKASLTHFKLVCSKCTRAERALSLAHAQMAKT